MAEAISVTDISLPANVHKIMTRLALLKTLQKSARLFAFSSNFASISIDTNNLLAESG